MSDRNRSKETVDAVFGAPRGLTAVGDAAAAYMARREAQRRLAGISSVRFIPKPPASRKGRGR